MDTAITSFAEGLTSRYTDEVNDPNGVINMKKIIKIASNENDVVLDCFNGVGSTGEAALSLNRKYIGIEIDKKYFDITTKRIEKYNVN